MNTIAQIDSGGTPLKANSAMAERGESGKTEKNTMLTGPESRSMAKTCGPCEPISFWLNDSADAVSVPSPKASKKALNADAAANNSTMRRPFCGWKMHKASTNISAGNMGKNPSKTEKMANRKMIFGSEPWRKSAVSTR